MLRKIKIINKLGMHARASAKFVQVAKRHVSTVHLGPTVTELVNGKSMMQIMTLAASQGTDLVLKVEGEDQDDALNALIALIEDRFGEGE